MTRRVRRRAPPFPVDPLFVRHMCRLARPRRLTLFDLADGAFVAGDRPPADVARWAAGTASRFIVAFVTDLPADDRYPQAGVVSADGIPCGLLVLWSRDAARAGRRVGRVFHTLREMTERHLGNRLRAENGAGEISDHRKRLDFLTSTFRFDDHAEPDLGTILRRVLDQLVRFAEIDGGFIYLTPTRHDSPIPELLVESEPLDRDATRSLQPFIDGIDAPVHLDGHAVVDHLLHARHASSSAIAAPIRCERDRVAGGCPFHDAAGAGKPNPHCPCWTGGLFVWRLNGLPFNPRDREFTRFVVSQLLFRYLAYFLRYERKRQLYDMEIARQIQRNLLPRDAPAVDGIELRTHNIAAEMIGGDFYAFHAPDEHELLVAIGNISGKSVSAALLHALIQCALLAAMARPTGISGRQTAGILARLNRELYDPLVAVNMFITLLLFRIDLREGRIECSNAGHCRPLHRRSGTSQARPFSTPGPPLGMLPVATYETTRLAVAPGDLVLMYTDGMTEVFDAARGMYGDGRLAADFAGLDEGPVPEMLSALVGRVREFTDDAPLRDDQTAILFRATRPGALRAAPGSSDR